MACNLDAEPTGREEGFRNVVRAHATEKRAEDERKYEGPDVAAGDLLPS